jgi:hypothetical protein
MQLPWREQRRADAESALHLQVPFRVPVHPLSFLEETPISWGLQLVG